MFVGCFGVINK